MLVFLDSYLYPSPYPALDRELMQRQIPAETKIRIAYLGRLLKDGVPLLEQGFAPGHMVNALVTEGRS